MTFRVSKFANRTTCRLLVIIFLVLVGSSAFATAQQSDIIIFEGEERSLLTNPLEQSGKSLPASSGDLYIQSSGNWRGYVATFQIKKSRLFLIEITSINHAGRNLVQEMFNKPTNVFARWYSGRLVIPDGEMVRYVHMGYGSLFARYIIIQVKQGKVLYIRKLSLEEFEKSKAAE